MSEYDTRLLTANKTLNHRKLRKVNLFGGGNANGMHDGLTLTLYDDTKKYFLDKDGILAYDRAKEFLDNLK